MAAVSVLPGELSHHPHQLLSVTGRGTMWPQGAKNASVFSRAGPSLNQLPLLGVRTPPALQLGHAVEVNCC